MRWQAVNVKLLRRLRRGESVNPASLSNATEDRQLVITVDGPAAAGKSTVARALARRLGFRYLDTGAFYRAVTWKALESGLDMADARQMTAAAQQARVELKSDGQAVRVLCDGRDVTREIRTPQVTQNIYHVADEPSVRKVLIERQRQFSHRHDLVAEGRDQGTEVFPDAEVKFYLDASVAERARRRLRDLVESGKDVSLEEVTREIEERDARDRSRPMGALRKAAGAVVLDSTDLTAQDVVELMLREIERRGVLPSRS